MQIPLYAAEAADAVLGAVLGFFAGMIAAFAAEFLAAKKESGDLSALSDAWREDIDRAKRLVRMQ